MNTRKSIDLNNISKVEKRMIEEILALKERPVNKIMIPSNEVVAFFYKKSLGDVINCYNQAHYSRYPVYIDNLDSVVGVLYIKDIIPFWYEYKDASVVQFVRFAHFIFEDRPAFDVFLELQRLRLSFGVVIDEFGGVSGIITIEDLIEEIVGEIEDEFDERKKPFIKKLSDKEYLVNARMEIDDFADYFSITIEEDDISTVSGLILKYADRIPRVGEEIRYKNLKFKVISGTRRKVNQVKLTVNR